MISGVSFEAIQGVREAPCRTELAWFVHRRTSTRAPSARLAAAGVHHRLTGRQSGEHFHAVAGAFAGGDEPGVRAAVFDHEHRLQLAPLHHGRGRNCDHLALAHGKPGAPEHSGTHVRHAGQVDLHDVGAGGCVHSRHDFGNARLHVAVECIERDLDRLPGLHQRQLGFFDCRLQPVGAFALQRQQRRTGRGEHSRLHLPRGYNAGERRGDVCAYPRTIDAARISCSACASFESS